MQTISESLEKILEETTDETYVRIPCKVTNINGNFVDVFAYINDDEPDFELYNIPIKREETQSAYIFLGIKKGDYGTLCFYDRDIADFIDGNFDYNGNEEQHSINSRCFELGFIPNPSAFIYPTDQEIEIGLKDGKAKISINANGDINIVSNGNVSTTVQGNMTATVSGDLTTNVSGNANVTVPTTNITSNVNITGNLEVSGTSTLNGTCTFETKPFMAHTHMSSAPATPTGGVL